MPARSLPWGNQEAAAWARLAPLAAAAPVNAAARRALAALMLARGWAASGAQELRIAAGLAPEDLASRMLLAEQAARDFAFAEAQARSDALGFVAIAFHGVADDGEALAADAIRTRQLIRFLDWLAADADRRYRRDLADPGGGLAGGV